MTTTALGIRCPICHVGKGKPCVDGRGLLKTPHALRTAIAERRT